MKLLKDGIVHITDSDALRLVPHLYIDGDYFRQSEKRKTFKMTKKEAEQYHNESFTEAGIENIKPIRSGLSTYALYALRDLQHEKLLQYVHEHCPDGHGLKHYVEGGLSLVYEGSVLIQAMCCSDFTNIEDWQRAAKYRSFEWQMHWNGHPWRYVRYRDSILEFTDYEEERGNAPFPDTILCTVSPELLQKAVNQAKVEMQEFHERLWLYVHV